MNNDKLFLAENSISDYLFRHPISSANKNQDKFIESQKLNKNATMNVYLIYISFIVQTGKIINISKIFFQIIDYCNDISVFAIKYFYNKDSPVIFLFLINLLKGIKMQKNAKDVCKGIHVVCRIMMCQKNAKPIQFADDNFQKFNIFILSAVKSQFADSQFAKSRFAETLF